MGYHRLIEFRENRNQKFPENGFRFYCSRCSLSFKSKPVRGSSNCHPKNGTTSISPYPSRLRPLLNQLHQKVSKVFDGIGVQYWKSDGQQPRYLIWLQWSRILNISFDHLVKMVVQEYRTRLSIRGPGLGLSLSALTGPRVQEWVFSQQFGNKLPIEKSFLYKNQYQSLDEYREQIETLRRMKRQERKAYRGSKLWVSPKKEIDAVLKMLNGERRGMKCLVSHREPVNIA